MNSELKDIWKDNLKSSLSAFSGYINWLVIFNLTIALTYCVQYLQLKKQQQEVKKYDLLLKRPWNMLQTYYEETETDSIAGYANKKILPSMQLCMLDILGNTTIADLKFPPNIKANALKSLVELKYIFNAFVKYNSYLTEVSAAKRNITRFEDLDKAHLNALLYIWSFDTVSNKKRFKEDFKLVVNDCETYYRDTGAVKMLTIYGTGGTKHIPKASPELLRELSFALTRPDSNFQDFNVHSKQLVADFRTFFQKNTKDSLKIVQNALDSNAFETLNKVNADKIKTQNKIEDFESGSSVSIPLTNISISLIQFITIAGMINLLIICYSLILCNKIKYAGIHYVSIAGDKIALVDGYFYNWTYSIHSKKLLIILFASGLSFCSVLSLLFALLLGPISDNKFNPSSYVVIWFFALFNFILGIIASKKYVSLDQRRPKDIVSGQ